MMLLYSGLLTVVLAAWTLRYLVPLLRTPGSRDGLAERFGRGAEALLPVVTGKRVVWVQAVSVGEVLAASRLVGELEAALGSGWVVVVSTTTKTGQALAKERFGADRVFYMPLDFAFAVRAYMRVLQPSAVVLIESEVWPRMMHECRKGGVPVVVVNARVSDRSFGRSLKVRWIWSRVLRQATLWLAQSEEDARRLVEMGARKEAVKVGGNLKYDVRAVGGNAIAKRIGEMRGESRIVIAGSTLEGEEEMLLSAWPRVLRGAPDMILVIAPRHPERFAGVLQLIQQSGFEVILASELMSLHGGLKSGIILLLDTIGDLAAVYSVASVAFIGGSLVPRGGHNPLEAARFGVPVLMGESYENFRDIVQGMKEVNAIGIVKPGELEWRLIETPRYGQKWGTRGRLFAESRTGATKVAVNAILELVKA